MNIMKHLPLVLLAAVMSMMSCNDYETYAEQKEKENDAINKFIADSTIKVITEAQFFAQDTMTDASKNEFVLFDRTGIYMQIVEKGCGERLKNGERTDVICRFSEFNVMDKSAALNNIYADYPDVMNVYNNSGTINATFDISLFSAFYSAYQTTAVPAAWLVPLQYVNLGVTNSDTDRLAKVRLIVPHSQGHQAATQNVTPYYYEITMQRGR